MLAKQDVVLAQKARKLNSEVSVKWKKDTLTNFGMCRHWQRQRSSKVLSTNVFDTKILDRENEGVRGDQIL